MKPRVWGVAVTMVFHALVLLALLYCFLTYPPKDATHWPQQPPREITFEEVEDLYTSGEFVRTGDSFDPLDASDASPSNADEDGPTQDGPDAADSGAPGDPTRLTSSATPSPAKTDSRPKGPTKEEKAAEEARREAARRQQARKTADDATRKAFGGSGSGKNGQPDGNSDSGATSGTPGNGVKGRTLEKWGNVASTKIGVIAIRVKVNSRGKVTSAQYTASGSEGAVAADRAMRERCRQKSLECSFSVKEGAPEASGTIYWRFR